MMGMAKLLRLGSAASVALGFAAAGALGCSSADGAAAAPPPPPVPVAGPLAFAGAAGHGAGARGGRNGQVMIVTTLADRGTGSLRTCLEATGARVCVFRVSGVIRFASPPIIRNPFLTIAGQTAPGGGIILAHEGGVQARTPLLIKNTHDVVVRHIRVRLDRIGVERGSEDAFTIEGADNVILDHVSGSWARDELVGPYGDNDRITISNSIFAEGIPRHDKCALLGSDPVDAQRLSFIGNLCAHNGDRNPDINFPTGSCIEVLNNVFYNAASQFTEVWEQHGSTPVSIVGNVYRAGPNTGRQVIGIDREVIGSVATASVYLWDNLFEGDFIEIAPEMREALVNQPPCALTLAPVSAARAFALVLQNAGAFPRDSVDARIVTETRNGGGRIVSAPGLMPLLKTGQPYPDSDRDGMDDRWEAANGARVGFHDPWADSDRDGVPNLDEFLDEAHQRVMSATTP